MARFWLLLGAGLLGFALSEATAAAPSVREDADDHSAVLSVDDADLVSVLQKAKKADKKHYSVDKRVRGLKQGIHPIGTTPNGRHIHAHANKAGKVTGVSLTRKSTGAKVKHGKVVKAKRKPGSVKRLPNHKTALGPSAGDETVHVANRQIVLIGFQIFWVSSGIQFVRFIWMPVVVVAPPVVEMAEDFEEGGCDAEVRSADPSGPVMFSVRQGDVAILPTRRMRA